MIKHIENSEEFETLTKKKCLVDFYADWCGPCKMMGNILEEAIDEIDIPVFKVNTDLLPDIATKFGVMSIPTLILMDEGKEVSKRVGYMSKDELLKFIK